uniref:Uncharacterized protein n=1 Tax=Ciona intestinalis TaxID=7719 RepID=H2XSV8_CIOIN
MPLKKTNKAISTPTCAVTKTHSIKTPKNTVIFFAQQLFDVRHNLTRC